MSKLPAGFDGSEYLAMYADVREAGIDPAVHYLRYGRKEGRLYARGKSEPRAPEAVPPQWKKSRINKTERIKRFLRPDMEYRDYDGVLDFLTDQLRQETKIVGTHNVSANGYDGNMLALIEKYPNGLVLDCGAGKKDKYFDNVVNYEIVKYASTDVLGVGEYLPFVDGTFDAVISIAVLEHVRDPFQCAKEISRVLKRGGDLYCSVPFLQPLHGYPHHYFNASPQGIRRLFEDELTVTDVCVLDSTHPIWSLSWILNSWRNGIPEAARPAFGEMRVKDLIGDPRIYLSEPFCAQMTNETKLEIASATVLTARKD
jgi:SAM-dependent methyltransferase